MHEAEQRLRPVAGEGDTAMRGFQPDDPAVVSRGTYRAADVAADAERRETSSNRCGFTATRAAGGPLSVPGIDRPPKYVVAGFPPEREFGEVGLSQRDPSGHPQTRDHCRVGRRDMVREQA